MKTQSAQRKSMSARLKPLLQRVQEPQLERGQALAIALVFMLLVSLMIAAALTFASSALKQGSVIEDRTKHLYTSDAGVESAWQRISTGNFTLPMTYQISSPGNLTSAVTITLVSDHSSDYPPSKTYLSHSVSTSATGKITTIDAQLEALPGNYYYFLDNVATTEKNINIKNKIPVNGWIQDGTNSGKVPIWPTSDTGAPPPPGYGFRSGGAPTAWPTSTQLTSYYMAEVNAGTAAYYPGGWSPSGAVTLTSNVYVAGNFNISGGPLNLNGYVLFVDGNVTIHHVDVDPPPATGAGVIAATGNVEFWPNQNTGDPTHGVFVFCLGSAGAEFQPGGNFYGWIAAQNGIQLKSGNGPSYSWVNPNTLPGGTLDFPGLNGVGGPGEPAGYLKIITWKITYH